MAMNPRRLYKPVSSSLSARLPSSACSTYCFAAHRTARMRSSLIGQRRVSPSRASSCTARTSFNKLARSRLASESKSWKTSSVAFFLPRNNKRETSCRSGNWGSTVRLRSAASNGWFADLKSSGSPREQLLNLLGSIVICLRPYLLVVIPSVLRMFRYANGIYVDNQHHRLVNVGVAGSVHLREPLPP